MAFNSGEVLNAADLNDLNIDTLTTTGNVGIGETSPERRLHVNAGGTNAVALFESTDSFAQVYLKDGDASSSTSVGFQGTGDDLRFVAGGSVKMALTNDGKVGIGDNSPVAGLDIATTAGDTWTSNNWDSGLILNSASAIRWRSNATYHWGMGTSGDQLYLIKSGADDTSSPASYAMTLYGANMNVNFGGILQSAAVYNNTTGSGVNMHISSSGYFYRSTSSGKYKTDVETMGDKYADAILRLRPVWYRSLSENDPADWGYWGFIAEEVAEVDPRLVNFGVPDDYVHEYDDDGQKLEPAAEDRTEPEGVQYDRIVPHLVNLLQRHESRISELEQRIAELEAA